MAEEPRTLVETADRYLDGRFTDCGNCLPGCVEKEMEFTNVKGIFARVPTSDLESSRPVWVAKRLRHDDLSRSRGTGYFCGDLNEIYIFDGALNQRQIENLMLPTYLPPDPLTKNPMKSIITSLLLSLATLCPAEGFKELVTFGDSLTDMGNRSVGPDKKDVKFRQTWVAQLAGPTMMNIPDFKPSGMNTYYFGGTNYAVGGSTSGYAAAKGRDANKGQNLTVQVSKRYLNPEFNKDGVKKDALHIVRIGTNDLMALAIQPEQIGSNWATLNQEAVKVVKDIEGQIQALATAGVNYIMWGNLSDGSKFPSVNNRVAILGTQMAPIALTAISDASKAYNTEMDAAITRLQAANPSLKIIKLDMDARFNEIAADPKKFGFVDVTTGANDSKHLFSADGLHPTPAGHKNLAEFAFQVISDPATPKPQ